LYGDQVNESSRPLFDIARYIERVNAAQGEEDPLWYVPVDDSVPDPGTAGAKSTLFVEKYIEALWEQGYREAAVAVGKTYRVWVLKKGYAAPNYQESPLLKWVKGNEVAGVPATVER